MLYRYLYTCTHMAIMLCTRIQCHNNCNIATMALYRLRQINQFYWWRTNVSWPMYCTLHHQLTTGIAPWYTCTRVPQWYQHTGTLGMGHIVFVFRVLINCWSILLTIVCRKLFVSPKTLYTCTIFGTNIFTFLVRMPYHLLVRTRVRTLAS